MRRHTSSDRPLEVSRDMRATSMTSRSTVSSLARRASSRARARRRESARRRDADSGRGRRPDDSTDARGTVFDAHDDGKLGRRDRRPVLRVGRAQTLPPPNEKIVTEKKMARFVRIEPRRRGRSAERWRAGNRAHRTVKRGKEFVVKFDDVWTG